jgi:hypothetical protein
LDLLKQIGRCGKAEFMWGGMLEMFRKQSLERPGARAQGQKTNSETVTLILFMTLACVSCAGDYPAA